MAALPLQAAPGRGPLNWPDCSALRLHEFAIAGSRGCLREIPGANAKRCGGRRNLGRRVGSHSAERLPRGPLVEKGCVENFNEKLREELLDREWYGALFEAMSLMERWRRRYNAGRRHSSLGYRPPALESLPKLTSGAVWTQTEHLSRVLDSPVKAGQCSVQQVTLPSALLANLQAGNSSSPSGRGATPIASAANAASACRECSCG